jgi:tRNA/tmRNA/rRNA uracil-C5-methylase (TrmA/RlmC/RlmD family)
VSSARRLPGQPPEAGDGLLDLVTGEAVHGGWCVARDHSGRVVFVRHALPGERVRARVTDCSAKFARAEAVEITEPSPDRVPPPCPHARPGGCGGCDWQHASLAAQRRLKAEVVRQQLRRIAGTDRDVTVEPVAGDEGGLGWRTRVRFAVAPDGTPGLLRHRSHDVVAVGDCLIAHPLVRAAGVTRQRWDGARWVEVTVAPESGERALIVALRDRQRPLSLGQVPGRAADAVLAAWGGRLTRLRGRAYLRRTASGRQWRAGAGVFWQGHPGAATVLTAAVLEALAPRPADGAIDLYCGAGLFTGALAAAVGPGGMVAGVEADAAAVRDARRNLRMMPWAQVHQGDAATVLSRRGWPGARLAVLDPPRTGAGRMVIERLLRPPAAATGGALERVAYVSCDPATLARDIAVFAGAGWRLEHLRAFDIFPMTHHVECVATLVAP